MSSSMTMAPVMANPPTVENSFGPFMIGSWLNIVLWTVECIYTYRYFSTYRRDHWFLRFSVGIVLVCGTATSVGSCIGVFTTGVTNFGNVMEAIIPSVYIAMTPLFSGLTAFIGQSYLIWRYRLVSKNWIVSVTLEIFSLTGLGLALWSFSCLVKLSQGDYNQPWLALAPKLLYSVTAFVDTLIALALVHFLWTLARREVRVASTQRLLTHLMMVAFESGAVTTFFALATLVAFLTNPHAQIAVPFSSATGFFQAFCLLYNLNLRNGGIGYLTDSGNPVSTSYPLSRIGKSSAQAQPVLERVTVHQATIIHEDKDGLENTDEEKQGELQVSFMPSLHASKGDDSRTSF